MPTISIFYGIVIQMYWRDHGPPHFHALYAEHEVLVDIQELRVLRGLFATSSNGVGARVGGRAPQRTY